MKVTDIDAKTNTVIERDATEEELAQMQLDLAEYEASKIKEEAAKSAKISALAKLSALGFTTDDFAALGL